MRQIDPPAPGAAEGAGPPFTEPARGLQRRRLPGGGTASAARRQPRGPNARNELGNGDPHCPPTSHLALVCTTFSQEHILQRLSQTRLHACTVFYFKNTRNVVFGLQKLQSSGCKMCEKHTLASTQVKTAKQHFPRQLQPMQSWRLWVPQRRPAWHRSLQRGGALLRG